jgi:hypothetical protein
MHEGSQCGLWSSHDHGSSTQVPQCHIAHCTASTRHPCGVLRVSLCAACPLEARPFVRVLSVAFPPTTPSCLVQMAHGPAAVLHCDLSGLRGNYAFSCTHAHTPSLQARTLVRAAASPVSFGPLPGNAGACRTMMMLRCNLRPGLCRFN